MGTPDAGADAATGRQHGTDHLGSHKVAGIKDAMQAAGAQQRSQLPYSAEHQPIEQVFAKRKMLLTKAGKRTAIELGSIIGDLLEPFVANEYERSIQHAIKGKAE